MRIRFTPRTSERGPVADVKLLHDDGPMEGWEQKLGAIWRGKRGGSGFYFTLESSAYVKDGEVKRIELYIPVGDAPHAQMQALTNRVLGAYEGYRAQQQETTHGEE